VRDFACSPAVALAYKPDTGLGNQCRPDGELYRDQRKRSLRLLHALSCGQWLHVLPLPGGGYRVPTSAFVFHAVAGVRAKAVLEFLLFEILRLFRTEFGRDKRGLGARSITGSVSADAPARTATPQ
jgi:hypothetical protein